jgi:dTDP-D-glucose 4,6-dehydratase
LPFRTWLHAEDTAKAVITIITSGVVNDIFNISGNFELQNIEVIKKIIYLFNGDTDISKYLTDVKRPGQDVRYAIDDTKLQSLGWKPEANFDNELAAIVKYYTENFVW